jgi:hypothetical protein
MEMNCEHGISIHRDCAACNTKYLNETSFWETTQIRRELATLDQRLVDLSRERSAERMRRINAESDLFVLCNTITEKLEYLWTDKSFAPADVRNLLKMAQDMKSARMTNTTPTEEDK